MAEEARPVQVHLFAAARAAAGASVIEVPPGSLGEVLASAVAAAPGLEGVLERCSVLVEGLVAPDRSQPVQPGERVDVLPPFAGG